MIKKLLKWLNGLLNMALDSSIPQVKQPTLGIQETEVCQYLTLYLLIDQLHRTYVLQTGQLIKT